MLFHAATRPDSRYAKAMKIPVEWMFDGHNDTLSPIALYRDTCKAPTLVVRA